MEGTETPQLRMVWPIGSPEVPLSVPQGYAIRTYEVGDEARFLWLMEHGEFDPWDDDKLHDNIARVIPGGWFFAVEETSNLVVGTVMCLHNYTGRYPFTGDIGWLACDPGHRGRGLGLSLAGAATRRFLDAGYRSIQLHTECYRLPAVHVYLKLGYLPVIDSPIAKRTWKATCGKLGWPFRPDAWQERIGAR